MIEYDDFIYLDVYRTGSTHVIGLLEEICTGKPVRAFRHAALTKGRPWGLTGGKPVFATVRNPWDWYVSLWAIGSDGKSAIRKHLAPHLAAEELASLYDRADPRAAFSRWLARIHDAAFLDRVMKEHLPESGLASAVGLYTYRFLRVTTRYPRLLLRRPFVRDPDGAVRHHRRFKAYQTLLRNESLDDGLIAFVARHPRGGGGGGGGASGPTRRRSSAPPPSGTPMPAAAALFRTATITARPTATWSRGATGSSSTPSATASERSALRGRPRGRR